MQQLDRRGLIGGLGAALLAAGLHEPAAARRRQPFFARNKLAIGLQIYTLGPDAGKDIDATFAAVARIGYTEIELPGLLGQSPAALAAAAARAGLAIRSVHVPVTARGDASGLNFGADSTRLAEMLGAMGAKWAVAPIMILPDNLRPQPGEDFGLTISRAVRAADDDLWKRTAAILNTKAQELRGAGIKVAYHNHNMEFAPRPGGKTGWELLLAECQPGLVSFELDLGWVKTAGLDPVRMIERGRGRITLLHLKDVARDNVQSFDLTMKPTEVGSGAQNWPAILAAARRAGVQHYFVEQEPPFAIPRIEAAAKSYAYLAGVG